MIPGLAERLPPALLPFATSMSIEPAGHEAMAVGELLAVDGAPTILHAFYTRHGGADRRALLSFWTMHYFSVLIIPAVAALLCLDRVLPVSIAATRLVLDEEGKPMRLLLGGSGSMRRGDRADLAPLLAGHLHPMIQASAAHSGLSPRVFWCNAGVVLDYVLRAFDDLAPQAAADLAADISAIAVSRLGDDSLLSRPYESRSGEPPRRRLCCLRMRLPGIAGCGQICPAPCRPS